MREERERRERREGRDGRVRRVVDNVMWLTAPHAVAFASRVATAGTQPEVVRAILMRRGRILTQSEVIRAILLEYGPCCGVPHRRRR